MGLNAIEAAATVEPRQSPSRLDSRELHTCKTFLVEVDETGTVL